ncbi:MAG: quinol:cytochrome C oxidoreductase [Candidatus Kapaibacteriales bacterium]
MIETNNFIYVKKHLPKKLFNILLVLISLGLLGVIASLFFDSARASFNAIVSGAFLTSIALGGMFFIGIEYLTGAVWSVPFRRIAEILSSILVISPAILIIAILNIHSVFHWSHPEVVQTDIVLKGKAPYLNFNLFLLRFFLIFLLWLIFFFLFTRTSQNQDKDPNPKFTKLNSIYSAIFMPIFAISLSVFAIDWLMSLEPHWYSTIFAVYYFAGTFLAFLGAFTFASIQLNENGFLVEGLTPDHYYSMGALLFAFTNFWAYIAFSQFMLIWYANLPEETFWFINRGTGSWIYISVALIFIKFVIPYILLLPQPSKMDPRRLRIVALWIFFAHYYDLYWIVMPTYSPKGVVFGLPEISFFVLTVGIILFSFYIIANKINLVPIGDPKLKRGIEFHL